jgi:hypothetical protein
MKYARLLDTRGQDAADRYVRETARKAITFVEDNPPITRRADAVAKILQVEAAAASLPWAVYGGSGARRALEAAFVVADRVGGPSFGLAIREHALLAGQDFEVVRRNRTALADLGWLVRNPTDRLGRTSRFRLRIPPHIHSHQGGGNVGRSQDRGWLHHDAFRPDALGDAAWYVLVSIDARTDLEVLARRTGLEPETANEVVNRLAAFGVLKTDAGSVCRAAATIQAALDRVAASFGTDGRQGEDAERFEAKRKEWHDRPRRDVNVGVPA